MLLGSVCEGMVLKYFIINFWIFLIFIKVIRMEIIKMIYKFWYYLEIKNLVEIYLKLIM